VPSYQVLFNGTPADEAFYDIVSMLEIEENADLPDAISLQLPVAAQNGELSWVGDARIAPYSNIAVVITPPDGGRPQCIFDGYVLTQKVRVPTGTTGATVEVWGQDATVLMGLTETVKEWSGVSDVDVAAAIFATYGATPASENSKETAPSHTEDSHTLMQRGSDIDFLRRLARRTGRWCRVFCQEKPGVRTGYFASPDVSAQASVTITVNTADGAAAQVLEFSWDVARPTKVTARQVDLNSGDKDGVSADASDSGLSPLDSTKLASFAGKDRTVILTAAADSPVLPPRAAGLLREAGWFAKCEGSTDLAVLKQVLRVGSVVSVAGCGSQLSGSYLVWRVRHSITTRSHKMAFVLTRNAVGASSGGGGGLLP
jgi:phage protein D